MWGAAAVAKRPGRIAQEPISVVWSTAINVVPKRVFARYAKGANRPLPTHRPRGDLGVDGRAIIVAKILLELMWPFEGPPEVVLARWTTFDIVGATVLLAVYALLFLGGNPNARGPAKNPKKKASTRGRLAATVDIARPTGAH